METANICEYVFPVIGGELTDIPLGTGLIIKTVHGTAFSIGSNHFLTAAHVVRAVQQNEYYGIGFSLGNMWRVGVIEDAETIDDYDLGIVIAETPPINSLSWRVDCLPMLQQVQVSGYPYSLDTDLVAIIIRSFSGYIVSSRTFVHLQAKPRIYELPFQCPRGLSGAPLVTPGSQQQIAAFIIGNHATQTLVYSDKEVISEPQRETIV